MIKTVTNFVKESYNNSKVAFFCEMANGTYIYNFSKVQDYYDFINKTKNQNSR